jgi:putative Holliday junction resolvase
LSRVLALDYGVARCGVALSDPSGTLATPLPVVERPATKKGLSRLVETIEASEAQRVVIGLPLTLAGEEGAQAAETRAFADRLSRRVSVPVEFYDERLTTAQAVRSGGSAAEDSRAAAHLLEAFLDAHRTTA